MALFTIIAGDPATNILTFDQNSNNGNASVARGEHVTWNLAPNASGIDHIMNIGPKPGSPNIFSAGPSQNGNSKNWQELLKLQQKG